MTLGGELKAEGELKGLYQTSHFIVRYGFTARYMKQIKQLQLIQLIVNWDYVIV